MANVTTSTNLGINHILYGTGGDSNHEIASVSISGLVLARQNASLAPTVYPGFTCPAGQVLSGLTSNGGGVCVTGAAAGVTASSPLVADQAVLGDGPNSIKPLPAQPAGAFFIASSTGALDANASIMKVNLSNNKIDIGGRIRQYGGQTVTSGKLLIGSSSSNTFQMSGLNCINGVSCSNQDGVITVSYTGTGPTSPAGGVHGAEQFNNQGALGGEQSIIHAAGKGFAVLATAAGNRLALQAAHDALPTAGGTIVLPAGQFQIDGTPITITKPTIIQGQGARATKLQTTSGTSEVFQVNTASACVFRDFWMTATAPRSAGSYIHFVTTANSGSIIENMVFDSHMVALDMEACGGWIIDKCTFVGVNNAGLRDIYAHSTVGDNGGLALTNCVFNNGGDLGTAVYITSGGGLRIANNAFLTHSANVIIDWTSPDDSSEFTIVGNAFDGQQVGANINYGLIFSGYTTGGTLSSCTVTGNTFASHRIAEIAFGGTAPEKIGPVTISGNNFRLNTTAIGFDGGGTATNILANTFEGAGVGSTGVRLSASAANCKVGSNSFVGTFGTKVSNASGSSIVGFTGSTTAGTCISTYDQGELVATSGVC